MSAEMIAVSRIHTMIGPMVAAATEKGLCLLKFEDSQRADRHLNLITRFLKSEGQPAPFPIFKRLQQQLDGYFAGSCRQFDIPLDIRGTPFQEKVWQALQTIGYGKTRTYSEQAILINQPRAVRAVGKANGDNRISIMIPCHRVIGQNGSLTGYGGGLWRKKFLLEHEAKNG